MHYPLFIGIITFAVPERMSVRTVFNGSIQRGSSHRKVSTEKIIRITVALT